MDDITDIKEKDNLSEKGKKQEGEEAQNKDKQVPGAENAQGDDIDQLAEQAFSGLSNAAPEQKKENSPEKASSRNLIQGAKKVAGKDAKKQRDLKKKTEAVVSNLYQRAFKVSKEEQTAHTNFYDKIEYGVMGKYRELLKDNSRASSAISVQDANINVNEIVKCRKIILNENPIADLVPE